MKPALLLFLFLLVFVTQLAFASSAQYCAIAKQDHQQHFGHHVHKANKAQPDVDLQQGGSDAECGLCQLAATDIQAPLRAADASQEAVKEAPSNSAWPGSTAPPVLDPPPRMRAA